MAIPIIHRIRSRLNLRKSRRDPSAIEEEQGLFIWARLRGSLRDQRGLGEAGPVAGAKREDLVVEVVMRVVQHRLALGGAVADPDIGAGLLFEEEGEILGPHARQQV